MWPRSGPPRAGGTMHCSPLPVPSVSRSRIYRAESGWDGRHGPTTRLNSAAMITPIALPANCTASLNHCARYVARCWRSAPCGCPGAPCRALRNASHGGSPNDDMSSRQLAARPAEYADEPIARIYAAYGRAGLRWLAAFVDLSCGDAGQTNPWPLSAPDGTVAIPDRRGGAREG